MSFFLHLPPVATIYLSVALCWAPVARACGVFPTRLVGACREQWRLPPAAPLKRSRCRVGDLSDSLGSAHCSLITTGISAARRVMAAINAAQMLPEWMPSRPTIECAIDLHSQDDDTIASTYPIS